VEPIELAFDAFTPQAVVLASGLEYSYLLLMVFDVAGKVSNPFRECR